MVANLESQEIFLGCRFVWRIFRRLIKLVYVIVCLGELHKCRMHSTKAWTHYYILLTEQYWCNGKYLIDEPMVGLAQNLETNINNVNFSVWFCSALGQRKLFCTSAYIIKLKGFGDNKIFVGGATWTLFLFLQTISFKVFDASSNNAFY